MAFKYALYYLFDKRVIVGSTSLILSSVDLSTQVTSKPDLDEKNWIAIKCLKEEPGKRTEAAKVLLFGVSKEELQSKKKLFRENGDIWTDVQLTGDGPGHGPPPGPDGGASALGDQPGTTTTELEESFQALSMSGETSSSESSSPPEDGEVEMYTLAGSDVTVSRMKFKKVETNIAKLFVQKLAALLYKRKELAKSTITGARGKKKFDEAEMAAIFNEVKKKFPEESDDQLRKAMDRKCYNTQQKQRKKQQKQQEIEEQQKQQEIEEQQKQQEIEEQQKQQDNKEEEGS